MSARDGDRGVQGSHEAESAGRGDNLAGGARGRTVCPLSGGAQSQLTVGFHRRRYQPPAALCCLGAGIQPQLGRSRGKLKGAMAKNCFISLNLVVSGWLRFFSHSNIERC